MKPQILEIGKQYGDFTITGVEKLELATRKGSNFAQTLVRCKCSCGTKLRLYANMLISGAITNCGCKPTYTELSSSELRHSGVIMDALKCNAGIAISYIRRGLSIDEMVADYQRLEDPNFKFEVRGHAYSDWSEIKTAHFGEFPISYVKYHCVCGEDIWMKRSGHAMVHRGPCKCDVYHNQLSKPMNRYWQIFQERVEVGEPKKVAFNKMPCLAIGVYNGICVNYNGDDGCLSEMANGKKPSRFIIGHQCYLSPEAEQDGVPTAAYSGYFGMMQL